MVALAGSIAFFGWFRTWSAIIMWPVDTPYMDMRVIQSAIISAEHGLNPHVSNPADRWGNKIDYPLLWVPIGKALNFTDESSFLFICTGLVLCFVGVCSFLIFCFPSFGLLASLISTATLNGIERANNDLLIFCLLFLAALWFPKLWSPIPILLGTL